MSNQKDFFSGNSHSQEWMENVRTLCSCSHCRKRHEPPVWPLSDPEDAQKDSGYPKEKV